MPSKNAPLNRSSIFGCLVGSTDNAYFNGLCRANDEFLKAIIRYSRFSEIHIFTHLQQVDALKSSWADYLNRYGSDKSVHFFPVHEIHQYFSNVQYQVFHQGDPWIGKLCALRDAYSVEPFPITGRAHTLSTDSDLLNCRDLILSPIKPCDSILYSSRAQKTVMRRLLSSASSRISEILGVALPYKGSLLELPLGIESNESTVALQNDVRSELGYQEDEFVILSLGRITPSDKMDLLPMLLVIADLVEVYGHQNIKWVIAGSGDAASPAIQSILSKAYELNIEDVIQFELSIDDHHKEKLYASCDLFFSLSDNIQESFGISPLEAMVHGKVAVLSNWNGYRELVEDSRSGYLIDTLSADMDQLSRPASLFAMEQAHLIEAQSTAVDTVQCTNIIHQLMVDPERRAQVGEAARQRVQSIFSWESIVQQYHVLVETLGKQASLVSNQTRRSVGVSYHHIFEHYPNLTLSDESLLRTTDRGIQALLDAESLFFYEELNTLLNTEDIKDIASKCVEGLELAILQERFGEHSTFALTVHWMLKYQLLEVVHDRTIIKKINRQRWWPEDAQLDAGIKALLSIEEGHRFQIIEPLLSLLDKVMVTYHGQPLNINLRADLLQPIWNRLNKQLLQTIGWVSEIIDNKQYAEVLKHIDGMGGVQYLYTEYPLWYKLNRRRVIRFLREVKILFQRLSIDKADIKNCFSLDGEELGSVQSISIPMRAGNEFIAFVRFDSNLKVVYKNRDIRLEHFIVGEVEKGDNFAGLVNSALDDAGVATLRMLPSKDFSHYGYCEFIHAENENNLSKHEAEKYFRRLGSTYGFALLLGLGDLHHRNIITCHGKPYIVDAKTSFSSDVLNAVIDEASKPLAGSARGLESYSIGKTGLISLLEQFHESEYTECSFRLDNGEIMKGEMMKHRLCPGHFIKVDEKHSLNPDKPSLCGDYSEAFDKGVMKVFQVVGERQREWVKLIKRCQGMTAGYLPRINRDMLAMQKSSLNTFVGFQRLDSIRLYGYFNRISSRICRGGEAVQRWFDEDRKEAVLKLAESMTRSFLTGENPEYRKEVGGRVVCSGSVCRDKKVFIEEHYFSQDSIKMALEVSEILTGSSEESKQYRDFLSMLVRQWLLEGVVPGRSMPEELRRQLPD